MKLQTPRKKTKRNFKMHISKRSHRGGGYQPKLQCLWDTGFQFNYSINHRRFNLSLPVPELQYLYFHKANQILKNLTIVKKQGQQRICPPKDIIQVM